MDRPDNSTFCVAPWFQIRNGNNLEKKVCCAIDSCTRTTLPPIEHLNNPHNINLKKNLHTGKRDPVCNKCWNDEDNNVKSLRQSLNGVLLNNSNKVEGTWLESYLKKKTDWRSDKILLADIKIGNTCNFACVMCIPDDSSQIYNFWMKNKDSEFVQEKLKLDPSYLDRLKENSYRNKRYHEYLDSILTGNVSLRHLQLLGGEPLLDKRLLKLLSQMDQSTKKSMSLVIITNGSINLNSVSEQLGDFKSIHFIISLEGIGDVQDYARYGSRWDEVESNILSFERSERKTIQINYTMQVTTVLGMKDLIDWCNQNNLPLSSSIVHDPDYLGAGALPPSVKQTALQMLEGVHFITNEETYSDNGATSGQDLINRISETKFDRMLYDRFIRYIEWYESGKNIKRLRNIFPQLYI